MNPQSKIVKSPEYSKQAAKYISGLDAPSKQRIRDGVSEIPKGDIKPLKGAPGTFRKRIGDWRILFSYLDGGVYVRDIKPRGDAYKGG